MLQYGHTACNIKACNSNVSSYSHLHSTHFRTAVLFSVDRCNMDMKVSGKKYTVRGQSHAVKHNVYCYDDYLLSLSYLVPGVYISSCLDQQFDTVRETMPRHLMQRSVAVLKQTLDIVFPSQTIFCNATSEAFNNMKSFCDFIKSTDCRDMTYLFKHTGASSSCGKNCVSTSKHKAVQK